MSNTPPRTGRSNVAASQEAGTGASAVRSGNRRRAVQASFVKLNPITLMKNPVMFVVEVGAALTTVFLVRDIDRPAPRGLEVRHPDLAVAVVHGAVRQLRRSHGGSARQGAGR